MQGQGSAASGEGDEDDSELTSTSTPWNPEDWVLPPSASNTANTSHQASLQEALTYYASIFGQPPSSNYSTPSTAKTEPETSSKTASTPESK